MKKRHTAAVLLAAVSVCLSLALVAGDAAQSAISSSPSSSPSTATISTTTTSSSSSSSSAVFSRKDLDTSIKYYEKMSSSEKLSPNDRLAILYRIKEKYAASKLDFGALDREIEKQNRLRASPPTLNDERSVEISHQASSLQTSSLQASLSTVGGVGGGGGHLARRRLSDISVIEKSEAFEILISADKPDSHNLFVLKDPDQSIPPKIVADFYGLTDALSASKKEISLGSAGVDKIKTAQFEKEPAPVARMVVYLKKNVRHTFRETPSGFALIIPKDDSEKGKKITPFVADVPSAILIPPTGAPNKTISDAPVVPAPAASAPSVALSSPPSSPTTPSDVRAAARASYKIEPGDVLYVTVSPADEITREVTVNPGGEISLPLAGVIRAAGLTPGRLAEDIKRALSKYITNPDVSVTVRQYARRTIFITGELKNTGGYVYKENMRLLELISQAGGFTDRADRKNVKILRGEGSGRKTFRVDVEELARSGDFSKDFELEPGDIVEVAVGFKKISVLGDVRNPGNYDYREGLKVVEAVSIAGGFLDTARIKEVSVLRKQGADTKSFTVDLEAILKGGKSDFVLSPEDTIYIPRKTISSAVWWVTNIMPWLSLISIVIIIRGGL
ncbi:MAG: SLBB domain-containing protein [Endomicrobiia bacterium]|nr:SLBB domain-containing protein [Endomicrobiia bacterium]